MNNFDKLMGWRLRPSWIASCAMHALVAVLCLSAPVIAHADLSIVTPSSTILQPKQISAEGLVSVGGQSRDALWLTGSINFVEFQGAELWAGHAPATAFSVQGQLLPETSVTPSASIGVRDIFNTTHDFSNFGYHGRSYYLVVGKTSPGSSKAIYPLRNAVFNVGLGTGVTNAVFGSFSSDISPELHDTIEYDGNSVNYRLAIGQRNGNFRVEYDLIHGTSFVGVRFQSPSMSLFDPFE